MSHNNSKVTAEEIETGGTMLSVCLAKINPQKKSEDGTTIGQQLRVQPKSILPAARSKESSPLPIHNNRTAAMLCDSSQVALFDQGQMAETIVARPQQQDKKGTEPLDYSRPTTTRTRVVVPSEKTIQSIPAAAAVATIQPWMCQKQEMSSREETFPNESVMNQNDRWKRICCNKPEEQKSCELLSASSGDHQSSGTEACDTTDSNEAANCGNDVCSSRSSFASIAEHSKERMDSDRERASLTVPQPAVSSLEQKAATDELSTTASVTLTNASNTQLCQDGSKCKKRFRSYQQQHWGEMYELLLEFQTANGHCSVPTSFENQTLARWVKRQRYQYSLLLDGKESTCLTAERVQALHNIRFVWDPQSDAWNSHYNDLKHFKDKFGHTKVAFQNPENPSLGLWVKSQRRQYTLWKQGKPSFLSPDRIRLLESIDFQWCDLRRCQKKDTKEEREGTESSSSISKTGHRVKTKTQNRKKK